LPPRTPRRAGRKAPEGAAFVADTLAANLRAIRRQRFWDQQHLVPVPRGFAGDLARLEAEDLEQEHVAKRMRDLGHSTWVQQTVSDAERGRRNVTVPELLSLSLVLGAVVGDLLDPHGPKLALDTAGRVQVEGADLLALVCGHTRRATVEWRGAELVGVKFRDAER
jgi:hypothetical protein